MIDPSPKAIFVLLLGAISLIKVIKIDKIRYTFSKYSDDHFRTNFISKYLDDTNLNVVEDFLKNDLNLYFVNT